MANEYEKYTSTFKQKVLEEYRPGIYGSGFKLLAKRFKIKGGHHLIMCWYQQWDGTVQSLNAKPRTGRPRTLTNEEVELDENHWIEIGKFRKFLQQISNDRLIFIDEIAIYGIMPPLRTLVAPGHQSFVIVDKLSAYAERFDFIGAINGSKPIACMTSTPVDRKAKDIQSVRKEVIHEWIVKSLAPAINRLNIDYVYLICDRSRAHNLAEMMQAFIMDILTHASAKQTDIDLLSSESKSIFNELRDTLNELSNAITTNNISIINSLNEQLSSSVQKFRVLSDEFDNESDDELNKYLEQRIDIESIDDNPLAF
ncbi:unnamed protein product [Rotaria sp. Silwood2]|nr:unnamed protein product [Rotaria sp. Silwood2]